MSSSLRRYSIGHVMRKEEVIKNGSEEGYECSRKRNIYNESKAGSFVVYYW